MAIPKIAFFGRINRATYWTWYVAQALVLSSLLLLFRIVTPLSDVILTLIAAPRLRDIGRSGWWAVAALAPDLAIARFIFPTLPLEQRPTAFIVLGLIFNSLFIVLGAWPGQLAANRFGEPPPAGIAHPFSRPPSLAARSDAGGGRQTPSPRIVISGRANRQTYIVWLTGLVVVVFGLGLTGVDFGSSLTLTVEAMAIAIAGPRLRDLGRSGWWAFGLFAVDFLMILILVFMSGAGELSSLPELILVAVIVLTPLVPLVLLGAWKGDLGANRYGQPPGNRIANLFARQAPPEQDVAEVFS